MPSASHSYRSRPSFADMLVRLSAPIRGADGEPWISAEFAERSDTSDGAISNWSAVRMLPREIEPILRLMFGSSAADDSLREAFLSPNYERFMAALAKAELVREFGDPSVPFDGLTAFEHAVEQLESVAGDAAAASGRRADEIDFLLSEIRALRGGAVQ